jgi:hypothetical protein
MTKRPNLELRKSIHGMSSTVYNEKQNSDYYVYFK